MAKAKATQIEVETIVKKTVKGVILELTQEEAQFLFDVVGRGIVGCSTTTRRKYTDDIFNAMDELGFETIPYDKTDFSGQLEFKAPRG